MGAADALIEANKELESLRAENEALKAQNLITQHGVTWHNGYRAACKEICGMLGLDTVDEIELLVKDLNALRKDQLLFHSFASEVDELRLSENFLTLKWKETEALLDVSRKMYAGQCKLTDELRADRDALMGAVKEMMDNDTGVNLDEWNNAYAKLTSVYIAIQGRGE